MILLMKTLQIIINAITIITLMSLESLLDMQIIFGLVLLLDSSISVTCIFIDKAKKHDKVMMVFNTLVIFIIAQIYTAITGIFSSKELLDYLYKAGCFCLNAIMMGVTFDAFKKYNEENKN